MGNLKIRGYARRKVEADLMEVIIAILAEGESSAIALKKGKKETEKILRLLKNLGIDLSKVSMRHEEVKGFNCYRDDDTIDFQKGITFMTSVDLRLVDKISRGIIVEEIDATYDIRYRLSNTEEISKQVLQEALLDSKRKAEEMAEVLGLKIVGVEVAKCDQYIDDVEGGLKEKGVKYFPGSYSCDGEFESLETELSPGTINIEKSIDVSWIVE